MRFANFAWWERLRSLSSGAENITVPDVQHVNVVNDGAFRGSRERAPYAQHGRTMAAPGAGVHNMIELRGLDTRSGVGPAMLLHYARMQIPQTSDLNGYASWTTGDGSLLTTATRLPLVPAFGDVDPEVSCQIFEITIATANLPATSAVIPKTNALGQTLATPSFPSAVSELTSDPGLRFATSWGRGTSPALLIWTSEANVYFSYMARWQAVRA